MIKPKGFFITGTDTDIGKTHVARILADTFSTIRKTTYMKAVQTGCTRQQDGHLKAHDYYHVMAGASRLNGTYEQHVPYRFEPTCSPHLAASLAKETISLAYIRDCYFSIGNGMDLTLVEGAGGILVPLNETTFMIDLIVHLALPVILVTTPRIGTLNHTFLTLTKLHESGVPVAGVVFNNSTKFSDPVIHEDNRRMIHSHTHPVPFLEIPHGTVNTSETEEFCDALIRQL